MEETTVVMDETDEETEVVMDETTTVVFDWFKETINHTQAVEYAVNNSKYKIYQNTLESVETKDIIPHCLSVKQKMKSVTSTQAHLDARYFDVMGRTFGTALRAVWDQLLFDNSDEYTDNEYGINKAIKDIVAIHAVEEDRYDTTQFLRNARKPPQMKVMSFYYRLLEINGYVEWMPGTEAKLDNNALKSAFFEAMPTKWKSRFTKSGHSRGSFTMAQTVRFFRAQESAAIKKQAENELFQKRNRKPFKQGTVKSPEKTPHNGASTKAKHASKSKTTRISDDAQCPIHPESDHVWGDCKSNHYSEKGKALRKQAYTNRKKQENHNESTDGENHMIQSAADADDTMNFDPTDDVIDDIINNNPFKV